MEMDAAVPIIVSISNEVVCMEQVEREVQQREVSCDLQSSRSE